MDARILSMTLEEMQLRRDTLLAEIVKANLKIESGAGAITKRPIDDLLTALATLDSEIRKAEAGTGTGAASGAGIGRLYSREGL